MRPTALLAPARWPWAAGLASAALLAGAHAFQAAGYAPCDLCLRQREVHWAALTVVAAWALLGRVRPAWRLSTLACWLLAAVFMFSAALAAFHAGVEWKWWPGPTSCGAGGASGPLDVSDLSAVLSGVKRVRPPACDEAAWRLAGISMAGWNAALSLGLAALSAVAARRGSENSVHA